MLRLLRRLLALGVVTAVVGLWAAAAAHDWWFAYGPFSRDTASLPPDPDVPATLPQVWGHAEAARLRARALVASDDSVSLAAAERLLAASLRLRPLHAPTWLDRAELQFALGDIESARRSIEIATALWPGRALLLGRAAWLMVDIAPADRALQGLMDYWAVAPQHAGPILDLARRVSGDPAMLVAAAEALWRAHPETAPAYQAALMQAALEADDPQLAQSLWQRLPDERRTDESVLFPYLRLWLAQAGALEADAIWQGVMGNPSGVVNGSFEESMVPLGPDFRPDWATPGWRYRPVGQGYRIRRDNERAASGEFSLRIDFAGTDNVRLSEPSQVIRVRPGTRYRLRGRWAAEGLTTRSGVYIALDSVDAHPRVHERTAARWGTWDWTPFEMDIEVPDHVLLLRIAVRRDRTNALDRRIAGTLWLDDISLVPGE